MRKRIKRQMCLVLASALTVLSLTACGQSASQPEASGGGNAAKSSPASPVIIKISLSQASTEPPVVAANHFKELVEERSGGAMKVEIYSDNQLGNERDVIEGVQLGTVEMAMPSNAPFTGFVPSMNIFALPFLFRDKAHMYGVLDSEIGMGYSADCEAKGFKLLGFLDLGRRHVLTTQKPINTMEDMKNLKIRTMENEVQLDSFTAFGANPLPMAYGEVYTALESKIIDGAEAANTNYYSKKFYEPAPNWAMIGWTNDLSVVLIGDKFYKSLSDENRKIIDESTREMIEMERELYTASEDECLEMLKEAGVKVTEPDRVPFEAAVQKVYDKWADQLGGRDKIDKILNYGL